MAENKKSFLIYCDLISSVEKLPDDKAGLLFKHILRYVNDLNPTTDDLLIDLIFEPIKLQMKRDLKKYEAICGRNRTNGSLGGRPPKPKETQSVNLGLKKNPKKPKEPDTDTDTDTDTVIINNSIIEAKPLTDYQSCLDFWLKEFHLGWTFNGTQGKALKSILTKISKIITDTGNEANKENILNMFKAVCFKLPEWFKDKDLNVIDSKFNEILTQIKNKQNGTITNNSESIFRKQN